MKVKVHYNITRWLGTFVEVIDVPNNYEDKDIRKELDRMLKEEVMTCHSKVREIFYVEEVGY